MTEFNDWFTNIDQNYSGAIEKHELAEVLGKVGLTEAAGGKTIKESAFYVNEGIRTIKKIVELHRIGKLNYLTVCELGKKMFKSFDFDANAILNEAEMKVFLNALTHEMNFASATMSKEEQ